MPRSYKTPNKRIIPRSPNGRFRRTVGADLGIGGICPVCQHFLLQHYDGDETDQPLDPQKWRYRCFTCEPKINQKKTTEAKVTEIKRSKGRGLASMIIEEWNKVNG